jgi:GTP 3',8-cyclase
MTVTDRQQRPLRDLRISVTDRCNFRCTYCMPREVFGRDFPFLERAELLTFEEIARVVGVFARLGVRKVRLTGGEPLLRRDLPHLVALLAAIDGIDDIALTTNGSLLPRHAEALRAAGLDRITVSLDSVDEDVFSSMADVDLPLAGPRRHRGRDGGRVRAREAQRRGQARRQRRRDPAAGRVRRGTGTSCGSSSSWTSARPTAGASTTSCPAAEIVERIAAVHPLVPLEPTAEGEVAARYGFADGTGEVGVITSVTKPFCGTCTRGRLSAVGELYTCLFAGSGVDLRTVLRGGGSDDDLRALVTGTWASRDDRYSALRRAGTPDLPRVEMSYIGG